MQAQVKKLICCYGTLKQNQHNNHVMENSKFLGEVRVKNYVMHSLGGFPAITKGDGEILGEVFEVTDKNTLDRIYQLEGYTGVRDHPNNWYDVDIIETDHGPAEIFYFKEEPNAPVVESGIWEKRY